MTYGQPSEALIRAAQVKADESRTQAIFYGDDGWSFDDAERVPRGAIVAVLYPQSARWVA